MHNLAILRPNLHSFIETPTNDPNIWFVIFSEDESCDAGLVCVLDTCNKIQTSLAGVRVGVVDAEFAVEASTVHSRLQTHNTFRVR